MSFKATSWAWELEDKRLKPPLFLVLMAICDGAHEDKNFECVLKHSTIARRAKVSEDSVARHVATLRSWGYLYVVKHRGEDGKQLTNRYVVLIDEAAKRHAYALGWDGALCSEERTEEPGEEGSRPANCGSDRPANEAEPTRKSSLADPHCCGSVIDSFNRDNSLPPSPQGEPREGGASQDLEKRTGERRVRADVRIERWEAFRKAWPWDATEMPDHARRVFMGLADAEQGEAVDGGPRYIAHCKANGRKIAHAKSWLDGKGWQALKARSVESAAALGGAQFFVRLGTAQFWRWLDYHAAAGDVPLKWRSRRDGGSSAEGRPEAVLMPMLFESGGRKGFWRKTEWPPALGAGARDGPGDAAA